MLARPSVLLAALASISGAQDQKVKLTARELFYSAVQTAKPAQTEERAKGPPNGRLPLERAPRKRIPVPQRQLRPSSQGRIGPTGDAFSQRR
jgi:hypothetical protein